MQNRLDGKIAVVTGASSGIGRSIVEHFVAAGASVVAFARNAGALKELAAAHPGKVLAVARLGGFLDAKPEGDQGRWWCGPVAWVLEDVRRLPEPIAVKGAQGLWNLPPEVEAAALAQVLA